jgi:hypothetical protein
MAEFPVLGLLTLSARLKEFYCTSSSKGCDKVRVMVQIIKGRVMTIFIGCHRLPVLCAPSAYHIFTVNRLCNE